MTYACEDEGHEVSIGVAGELRFYYPHRVDNQSTRHDRGSINRRSTIELGLHINKDSAIMATEILPPNERGYVDASILVTTDWLADHIDDPNVVVVDTDDPGEYAEGHIPGASNPPDNYYKTSLDDRTHIQGPEQFAHTMESLGISDDSLVVAYDRTGGLYALRLMWSLHYYRHTNVKMLDGGYQRWVADGRDVSCDAYVPDGSASFSVQDPNRSIYAGINDVLEAINAEVTTLLDVRTDGEWEGSNKRGGKRGGRIPGAIHLEWVNFHTGGAIPTLKTADEIRDLLADNGVSTDGGVITYCQGGIRAAQAYWVLKLVGVDSVRNYDASWREWGNNNDVPIEHET